MSWCRCAVAGGHWRVRRNGRRGRGNSPVPAHTEVPSHEDLFFGSERSAGKTMDTPYGAIKVEPFSVEACHKCHFVLMAVSGGFSKEFAPKITAGGPADGVKSIVIDNSSAWRYEKEVPLVIPMNDAKADNCTGFQGFMIFPRLLTDEYKCFVFGLSLIHI